VQRGLSLGLDPVDLLMGLVQPALYRIGKCWENGTASTREEALVTATCTNMLQSLLNRLPAVGSCRQSSNPKVLLVNAQGNFHTLGLQLVEFVLLSRGVPTLTITPGLGAREVLALVGATRPRVVGIGLSLPTHFRGAREVAAGVRELPEAVRPRVVVGGFAVKHGMQFDPELGFTACSDPRDLVAMAG
jgi:methanogenic corrinoid protein MtbC1